MIRTVKKDEKEKKDICTHDVQIKIYNSCCRIFCFLDFLNVNWI